MTGKVKCYFNLHKKCWSVVALSGPEKGRVIRHATTVLLQEPRPRVSEAGRQRVLREKRKNVHSYIVGYLCHAGSTPMVQHGERVSYNPYKGPKFTYVDTGEEFTGSAWALLQDKKVFVS